MTEHLRIVVADDEPDMREYFSKVLPRLGHRVVGLASTGAELVEQCRTARPDLVITDVKMPDRDGLDAVSELWREAPLPVIVMSAQMGEAEAIPVMAHLRKPVRLTDLAPAIARALGRFAQLREGLALVQGPAPEVE
jgi:response regulator NasT